MLLLGSVLAGSALAATETAATSSESTAEQTPLDKLLGYDPATDGSNDTQPGGLAGAISNVPVIGDFSAGFVGGIGNPFDEPERTAPQCAAAVQAELNEHNTTYETYVNDRVNADTNRDVVEVTCAQEVGGVFNDSWEYASVYIVADVTDGQYTNMTVVDDTDRTVDERVVLTGKATETLPDDLAAFTDNYATDNETPPESYRQRMAGKYAGDVYGTLDRLPEIPEKHAE